MIAIVITRVMGCYPNHRDLCLLWICGTDGAPGLGIAASGIGCAFPSHYSGSAYRQAGGGEGEASRFHVFDNYHYHKHGIAYKTRGFSPFRLRIT
jgi:hypothetical protein